MVKSADEICTAPNGPGVCHCLNLSHGRHPRREIVLHPDLIVELSRPSDDPASVFVGFSDEEAGAGADDLFDRKIHNEARALHDCDVSGGYVGTATGVAIRLAISDLTEKVRVSEKLQ